MPTAAFRFEPSFVAFFRGLAKNNDTRWFDANRAAYENDAKKPFEAFTRTMIERLAQLDPEITIAPKDAISRINRDTRFGKDKSPYHTHLSAAISKHGKKDKEYPGILFRVSHTGVEVFGGCYMPEPATLAAIRARIAADPAGFAKVVAQKPFVQRFGSLQGELQKRLPPELQAAAAKEPRVAMKQYYYRAELPAKAVTSAGLVDELVEHFAAALPVNRWLQRAF